MMTQTTNKHELKKKTTSRKDKVLNTILLFLYIAAVVISYTPFVFTEDRTYNEVMTENINHHWETQSLITADAHAGYLRPSHSQWVSLIVIMVIVFLFIIISYKTKALYFPICCLSIAGCIIFSNMCNSITSGQYTYTRHYDNWDYVGRLPDQEHIVKDLYRRSEFSNYIGTYLIIILIIAIAVLSFVLSLPFIKKTFNRIKQSIEKSHEDKLNRQKAFENMAHYTPTEQPKHFANNEYFFCTKCGYKNTADSRFCKSCGQKIE